MNIKAYFKSWIIPIIIPKFCACSNVEEHTFEIYYLSFSAKRHIFDKRGAVVDNEDAKNAGDCADKVRHDSNCSHFL